MSIDDKTQKDLSLNLNATLKRFPLNLYHYYASFHTRMEIEINLILLLFVITCQSKLGCTKQWVMVLQF